VQRAQVLLVRVNAHSHLPAYTLARSHARTHTPTHARTHARTHAHQWVLPAVRPAGLRTLTPAARRPGAPQGRPV
jgi:hypothetical protein